MSLEPLHDGWIPLLLQAAEHWSADTGLVLPDRELIVKLGPLLDRAATWTSRIDLTAARDPKTLVELYLLDALALFALSPQEATHIVDVGSGGGAPGLSVALLRPELKMTLVEPRAKRVAFLRTSAAALNCANVEVRRARGEELARGAYQIALSRATFAPAQWLQEGVRLATHGVWVFLASAEPPVLPGWRIGQDAQYRLPSSGAPRRAVCFVPEDVR